MNRVGLRTTLLPVTAALLLASNLGFAQNKIPAAPAPAAPTASAAGEQQYEQCLAVARSDPQLAYDQALTWRDLGGSFPADHCAAVALVALKRYAEAAAKLERLASAMMQSDAALRAGALAQAGNAWLLAGRASEAKRDFDAALAFKPNDLEVLIDRAEASAMGGKFFDAVDDLNRVLEIAPDRADALIYRASAYRQLDSLDLAVDDVERALKIEPDAVAGLLERGNIRRLKGDLAGAKADWQRLVELAPDSTEAVAAKTNLAHLDEPTTSSGTGPAAPAAAAKP